MPNDNLCPLFLEANEIKRRADLLRDRFKKGKEFPIDIEAIIERDLRIDIQPIDYLRRAINIDAFISSNFRILYVDKYEYMNERFENKLRFSFAHELSHLVLHAELYQRQNFNDPESYIAFQSSISERAYRWYETQANMFAAYFLMPIEELTRMLIETKKKLKGSGDPLIKTRSNEYLDDLVKSEVASYFGVSEDALSYHINNTHIEY